MNTNSPTPSRFIRASIEHPYSPELHDQFKRIDRFGEKYENCKVVGDKILLPRNCLLPGFTYKAQFDQGFPAEYENAFVARSVEQARIVAEARKWVEHGQSFILQSPTGSGKTYMGTTLAAQTKRRFLVIVTKEDIIKQWRKAFTDILKLPDHKIGEWRGDTVPNVNHDVVIGLVQSVMKGPDRYGVAPYTGFGTVLVDEVHRMGADQFCQAMYWLPSALRIGLSATPYRKDGKDHVFHDHIGPVRVKGKQEVMIPKILVQRISHPMITVPHDFGRTMGLNKYLAAHKARNHVIVNFLKLALKKDRQTIVFAEITEHLTRLHDIAVGEGISPKKMGFYVGLDSGLYSGSAKEKEQTREAVKTLPVIFGTYKMVSEATDIPWLDTAVLANPRADVNQVVGRIRREYENKKTPVVLDLQDGGSPVLEAYSKSRMRWYRSINAPIVPVS